MIYPLTLWLCFYGHDLWLLCILIKHGFCFSYFNYQLVDAGMLAVVVPKEGYVLKKQIKLLKKHKSLERLLMLVALLGTLGAILLYSNLWGRISEQFQPAKSEIHGVWIEQNVAPYAAQHIEIRDEAIMMNGHLVATHYSYNGRLLTFYVGDQKVEYQMLNAASTEMKLMSSHHYKPIFQLSGKHKKPLR